MEGKVAGQLEPSPPHMHSGDCEKHPDSVIVLGAFGYHGTVELMVLPKHLTINKERYLKLLTDHLDDCFIVCQCEIFEQDGALPHTAGLVSEWLEWVDYIRDWARQ